MEYEYMHHKDLFPLDSSDLFGFVCVCVGLMIAASGGIGGGGILVPILVSCGNRGVYLITIIR